MPKHKKSKRIYCLFSLLGAAILVGWLGYWGNLLQGTSVRIGVRVVAPIAKILDVTSPNENGTYIAGQHLQIKIIFDQEVYVNTTLGTPTIALNSGGMGEYISGSATDSLMFRYTIQSGELSSDLDELSSSALVLHGATIRNNNGVDASPTLPLPATTGSLGGNKNIIIALPIINGSSSSKAAVVNGQIKKGGNGNPGTIAGVHRTAPKKLQFSGPKKLQKAMPQKSRVNAPKKMQSATKKMSEVNTLKRIQKLMGVKQNKAATPKKSEVNTLKRIQKLIGNKLIRTFTDQISMLRVSMHETPQNNISSSTGLVSRVQSVFRSMVGYVSTRIPFWTKSTDSKGGTVDTTIL
jgi:hypothetical protein